MRPYAVHQFHAALGFGDAVSNDCFELQRLLWSSGVRSDVFASDAKPEVRTFVSDRRGLAAQAKLGATLLLHVSMGDESIDEVAALAMGKAVVHHNITPGHFFAGISEHNRHYAELGREQLRRLATTCELGIGDSEFNRAELVELGFQQTAVVPILVDWSGYDVEPDAHVMRDLADERTDVLAVGQILPQKAVHDVVSAFARYRERDPGARLHLVGSSAMSGPYLERVRDEVRRFGLEGSVNFAGRVSTSKLIAYYRGASVLLTLSDHEGFCVPLLEAMRFGLPIVAHAAAAIPETLADGGLLLTDKSPDTVAAALERAVGDVALRRDLIARGRARLAEFTPEKVGERLRAALATVGWDLAAPRRRSVAVVSSEQRCGILSSSQSLCGGLRANGHQVTLVGVRQLDSADLRRKVARIPSTVDAVIMEHENGIFADVPFVRALLSLWRRKVPVVVSLHELEPEKFHYYRLLSAALHYLPRFGFAIEALRLPWVTARIASWFIRYRAILGLMGSLPKRLVVHSDRAEYWVDLLTNEHGKVEQVPLGLQPLENVTLPRTAEDKVALRERLGLPTDRFIFISPGFFFRRKRFIEILKAAPPESFVVFSGTEAAWDQGYQAEVRRYIEEQRLTNVLINTEFETMGEYVAASDAVVLFYQDIFQSGVATHAVWAGLPSIYSDVPGFRLYHGAGLVAADLKALRSAMREIQQPEVYERLREQVGVLRHMLAPERHAPRYLVGLR